MVTFDINFEEEYERVRNPWAEISAEADEFYIREKPDTKASAPGAPADERGSISSAKRKQILARDDYTCQNCGVQDEDERVEFEVHHVVPKSLGGSDRPSNLVVLCHECHQAAHGWGTG